MSKIDEFVAYVAQFEPGFPNIIRGASPEEISALERLAGRPLPEMYREFLERMGHESGKINLSLGGRSGISHVIEYYRDAIETGEREVPHNCIVIGHDQIANELALEFKPDGEPQVVVSSGEEIKALHAESLEKLLYSLAFIAYRLRTLPYWASYTSSYQEIGMRMVLPAARQLAEQLGFTILWFSDTVTFCAERGTDAALEFTQHEGQGLAGRVAATSQAEVEKIGDEFVRGLGVRQLRQAA
jgi:hypothetical protein